MRSAECGPDSAFRIPHSAFASSCTFQKCANEFAIDIGAIFAVAAAHGGSAGAPGWGAGAQGASYLPAQIAIDPAAVVEAQPPTF